MGGQPLFVLNEDSDRTHGKDAQSSNISAGKAVSETVRTTLGPRGMDKMLVSDDGDVVITNDGATILEEMDIEHPAAQMIVEVAETQEDDVGDGTTTASVIAGELLSQAQDLLDDDVHPTTVVEGYYDAADLAHEAVDEVVLSGDLSDDQLVQVTKSSMTGKGTGDVEADPLAETAVEAVRHIDRFDGTRDDIDIEGKVGGSSSQTELIEGVLIEEDPAHENMPVSLEDATIGIVDDELTLKESEIDASYDVSSVDQFDAALDSEQAELDSYVEAIDEVGVDVLVTGRKIADRVQTGLSRAGILALQNVKDQDMASIHRSTGASRVSSVDELEADDLGTADRVHVEGPEGDEIVFFEGGAGSESVTLYARGGTDHVVDELERALSDAVDVALAAIQSGNVVPGAGATEITVADYLRAEAASIEGRKQLAVEAFADAIDVIPRTLAANTGMDPIDALVELRAANEEGDTVGIISEGQTGIIEDPAEHGILDPAAVKHEAIDSATEASTMIIRIDDV
ncbi:MAG: thermosome subunit alpha, partial [Halococcoides sp.]